MRINDTNSRDVGLSGLGKSGAAEGVERGQQGGSASRAGSAEDRVQLSSLSSTLQAAGDQSPAHAAKLERLSALVAAGKYQANDQAVSGGMIDESIKVRD